VRQQDAYPTNAGGAVKTIRATPRRPPPFQFNGNISVADCLAYCRLLKLTPASSAIPIDNCWSSCLSSPEINSATVVAYHTQDH